ncbi:MULTISPECIES: sensor histidine kinase [Methanobacterium]|uniref:histidine kinase n=2 Tax=Methanobacterium veterum TaxID=408577 RepID=A0A9E5A679_9EURY|nr:MULTISPECIES: PAS domain-containing sensor histidine kinase [Methanobacterium]MCZ3374300.1 PAS domain S-box protein [Methanobacterium veterum]
MAFLVGMTLYEVVKQLLFPSINIWESHVMTISFTTILAAILAYFVLNDREKLIKQLEQANYNLEDQIEERMAEVKRLANIVESSDDAIIGMDLNFRISSWNHGAVEMYGYSSGEIIGKHIFILMEPEEQVNNLRLIERAKNGESIEHVELECLKKDGSHFYLSITFSPIKNDKGNIVGISSISKDITRRKNAEEQLKDTINELKRSNDELQQFAFITSHDLQEPLRTIASYAQLIERRYKGKLDNEADEFIEFMVDGAKRMKQMIQGLLDYSRIETKGGKFQDFNAGSALNHALNNLGPVINENNAEVTYDALPIIFADENQMIRVFQNLIGNALKFHSAGLKPKIHISASKEIKGYIFSVADNGIGLEKEYCDKIFEVFKRLHSVGEYDGAGIGLAIVKRIIDRHNGKIWVESEYGEGSTFYFMIPFKESL